MPAERLDHNLAILAGDGVLPELISRAYPAALVVKMGGTGEPIGRIGDILIQLRQAGITHICSIGRMKRPNFLSLMPSMETAKLIMRYGFSFKGGDDSLLRRLRFVFETEGFVVIGAHTLCPELLAPQGVLTHTPVPDEAYDSYLAMARAFGLLDKGQAIVVAEGVQIDEEDGTGTDALIARNAGRNAILVKSSKPQQDLDMDMPTIGMHTIDKAIEAGFRGIIIEAGRTLFPERLECIARADAHNVFIMGLK